MSTDSSSRTKKVLYWATTGLSSLALVGAGFANVTRSPHMVEGLAQLGYPSYLATILGFWKLLGASAILAPGFLKLKEWAYAGIFFDLTGAAASHLMSGEPAGRALGPLVLLAVVMVSWSLQSARGGAAGGATGALLSA